MPLPDAQRALHELEVHQVELEMQNEALRQAQITLIASQEKYTDLYDFAPVGYFTFDHRGLISELNLTGAALLGVERGQLSKKPFSLFVAAPSRDTFHRHYRDVLQTGTAGTCELQLTRKDGTSFYASVQSVPVRDVEGTPTGVRSAITDIAERKGMEDALRRAHDDLDQRVKARTADLVGANQRLVASEKALLERLRFEEFVSNTSARFVEVAPDQIEREIEVALKRIVDFFRVSQCVLIKGYPEEKRAVITHAAHAEALSRVLAGVNIFPLFPWASEVLLRGGVIRAATLDDLPAEAVVDKETYRKSGVRSVLTIPVLLERSVHHFISISSYLEERDWPQVYIPPLQLLGEILINALERKRVTAQLEEQLRFEALLADLSARFINLSADQLDAEIEEAQRRICELLDLDRSTLWQFSETEPGAVLLTHVHQSSEGPVPKGVDARYNYPWTVQTVTQSGKTLALSKIEDLPSEAARDRETYLMYGTKSVLVVPLSAGGGRARGGLTFALVREERDWPETVVNYARLFAQVLANALARKHADEALRESEARLSLAADSAQIGLWSVDIRTRRLWNSRSSWDLLGLDPGIALTEDLFFSLVHPEDRAILRQTVEQGGRSAAEARTEYRIIRPDGTVRWLITRARLYYTPDGEPDHLTGVSIDITERKHREEALRTSEEKFRQFFENIPDYCYIVSPEGNLLDVSDTALRTLKYEREELVGKPLAVIYAPESRAKMKDIFSRWKERGEVKDEEIVIITKNGERRTVLLNAGAVRDQAGTLLHSTFVQTDITDRKRMEQEVQKAAEEWQTTFDSVQDLVMILDREFKVVRANAVARSFFGLPTESILGSHCHSLMHGTEEPVEGCPLVKMMRSKRHEETELYDETRHAWFRVSADPIFNEEGEIRQIVHGAKDITERKRLETETFAARRELLRTERLLRMGELTASLAHELNQPLTSILSNTRAALRFIQSDTLDKGELTEILQDIANDDKRAGNIIRSLRSMLKPEEGERELIAINDVLHEVVDLFHSEAVIRRIRVETDFAKPLPLINTDKVQLQQVAINLMMNAADSMLDVSENRRIVIQTQAADDGAVLVAIRDFGPGIDEKELTRIFEPFFTTKRSGLGMGLSLSRSIIEGQGGHIWAENNPDRGATFFFDLPAGKEEVIGNR